MWRVRRCNGCATRMGLIQNAAESEKVAASLPNNAGVYFVPRVYGPGARHIGICMAAARSWGSRGVRGRAHIVRAALESIAYQSREVLDCMARDSGPKAFQPARGWRRERQQFFDAVSSGYFGHGSRAPRSDGNDGLGRGHACGGRAIGLWSDAQLATLWQADKRFTPSMPEARRAQYMHEWGRAVERAQSVGGRGIKKAIYVCFLKGAFARPDPMPVAFMPCLRRDGERFAIPFCFLERVRQPYGYALFVF